MPRAKTALVTIPNGAAESNSVRLESDTIVGVYMSAAWTAANLAFLASRDGVSFVDVNRVAARIQVEVEANVFIPIAGVDLIGVKFLKLESVNSANGNPLNQGAERQIHIAYRQL